MKFSLSGKADQLESMQATMHLLTYLFPHIPTIHKQPGRYRFLAILVEEDAQLRQTLLLNQSEQIAQSWQQILLAHQSDPRFLHALSIAYWEGAFAQPDELTTENHYLEIGTALFLLLVGSQAFWDYFAESRWTTEQGERLDLTPKQQAELLQTLAEQILTALSTMGKQHFQGQRYPLARKFLHCLETSASSERLHTVLRAEAMPFALAEDESRITMLCTMAQKTLDDWCISLLNEAEKELTDADAISALPEGISKNFQGAIRVLQSFIELDIPVLRILTSCLSWYNDWCLLLYKNSKQEELAVQVFSAERVARRLVPLCRQEESYKRENQVLSQHYLFKGFVQEKPEEAIQEYEISLSWNPANENADELLQVAYLKRAAAYKDSEEFELAYQALEEVVGKIKDKKLLQDFQATLYFEHGFALAKAGQYRRALELGKKAYDLNPNELHQMFIEKIEPMAPEEEHFRLIAQAEEALEKERYFDALQFLAYIPASSSRYRVARQLQAVACYRRGIDHANASNLLLGEKDLREALRFCDDEEIQQKIKEQLAKVLNARANEAADTWNTMQRDASLKSMRQAKQFLEEALKLDPGNANAKSNLQALNRVLT